MEGVADVEATIERMLDQTGLGDRRHDQVSSLSGGNQQRINIAIGLLADPSVLLLDEPSAGLDPRQRARLWEFVAGLARRGTTVIFSTHHIEEASATATGWSSSPTARRSSTAASASCDAQPDRARRARPTIRRTTSSASFSKRGH